MKAMKTALVFVLFVASVTIAARAQTEVFVPGTASGYFGWPQDQAVAFVPAISVSGQGTITITYVSGTVTDCCGIVAGPDGVKWNTAGQQWPLQEAIGVTGKWVDNEDALIGAFVPASRVNRTGFQAIDGTKDAATAGIVPNELFFIGTGKSITVTQAGTLFLGINDIGVADNGGGFYVDVSAQ